jgi:dTDP-4-amino-4,6-dideoxygalactose transaminase
MTDIQAAIGIRQLEKLDSIVVDRRREIAAYYNDAFRDVECLRTPEEPEGRFSNYQSYSLYLRQSAPLTRNELMARLITKGITTRRGIMTSHRETAYRQIFEHISLPVSEDLSDRSILLPLYPGLTEEEMTYVAKAVKDEVAP